MADKVQVRVSGLRELRSDFRKMGGTANRELSKALKAGLQPSLIAARAFARDSFSERSTGALAGDLKVFATGLRAGIRSRKPYASVQHWGGTISPRGTPIHIRRTEFITRAIVPREDNIVDDLGDALEDAARKNGWK